MTISPALPLKRGRVPERRDGVAVNLYFVTVHDLPLYNVVIASLRSNLIMYKR